MTSTTSPRRRRTVLGWWSLYGAHLGLGFGLVGVVFGYIGYRQAFGGASVGDSVYGAVQLLVLNGGMAPQGEPTPWALNLGRLLCAIAFGSAFLLLMMRLGAASANRWRAQRTRRHRVVFGATPEARQLVLCGETRRRRLRCDAVLVGDLDEQASMELRRDGVAVIGSCDDEMMAKVIHGATSIVIAEHDDLEALAIMRRVRSIVETERIPLKVVLRSSALAETIRSRERQRRDMSVGSLPEAVAQRLTQFDRYATEVVLDRAHVVVVGRGDLAAEIAYAAVLPELDVSTAATHIVLELVAEPQETWPGSIEKRLLLGDSAAATNVEVRHHAAAGNGREVADHIRKLCAAESAPSLVFIAGLADTDVIVAGTNLGSVPSSDRIVCVLERDTFPAELLTISKDGPPTTHWVTLGELIDDPQLLGISVQERLGNVLMARNEKRRRAADAGVVLTYLLSDSVGMVTHESATEFAAFLIEAIANAGLAPEQRARVTRPEPFEAAQRTTISGRILERFPPPAGMNPILYRANVGRFVTEVPLRFAELGLDLTPPEGHTRT
jgi:hypothetical protein